MLPPGGAGDTDNCRFPAHKLPVVVIDIVGGNVAATLMAALGPLQFDTVIVPLPCISYVAVLPPCGLTNVAAGEVLQVKGPVPVAGPTVICPPIHAVNGPPVSVGGGIWLTTIEFEPIQPFTVVLAETNHGPVPLNMIEAFSS